MDYYESCRWVWIFFFIFFYYISCILFEVTLTFVFENVNLCIFIFRMHKLRGSPLAIHYTHLVLKRNEIRFRNNSITARQTNWNGKFVTFFVAQFVAICGSAFHKWIAWKKRVHTHNAFLWCQLHCHSSYIVVEWMTSQ